MNRIFKVTLTSIATMALSVAPLVARADLLGATVNDAQSALFESQATLVTASRVMNSAEEFKITAPVSDADATLKVAALDDSADLAKDKAAAAFDKAAGYLAMAQDATVSAVQVKYVTAADTYEKTAYYYSVAADLYLTAEQKTEALGAKLPNAKTSEDVAGNVAVLSLNDAKMALVEAKAAVAVQTNAKELSADALTAPIGVSTTTGVTQAATTVQVLAESVTETSGVIDDLVVDYGVKASRAPSGPIKTAYLAVVAQYRKASNISDAAVLNSEAAVTRFANAVPENPVNPGENLKWHIFQSDPATALAVMKYNFAQLSLSAIHWQGMTQNIAQNPDYYLDPANHMETITEYVNGFRASALQVASEAGDLRALVTRYNDQIAGANDADAQIWSQVSSYLVDIITIYDEISQSQYQAYINLTAAEGIAGQKSALVTQTPEVKSVLKVGQKVVAPAGELNATVSSGVTEVTAYTTAPETKVTVTLTKPGAKTVTATDVTDSSGFADVRLSKDYAGYSVSVLLSGKLLDKEQVTKP